MYTVTVILGIVSQTMLLVMGYTHYEDRVERYKSYLSVFLAAVLIVMVLDSLQDDTDSAAALRPY